MEKTPNPDSGEKQTKGFKLFAAQRIVIGAVAIVLLLWLVHYGLSFFDTPQTAKPGHTPHIADAAGTPDTATHDSTAGTAGHDADTAHENAPTAAVDSHGSAEAAKPEEDHAAAATPNKADTHAPPAAHGADAGGEPAHATAGHAAFSSSGVTGVAFVEAMIASVHYELNERFYGWRPNDIVEFTDNVNNYQLGVLEVTRRTAEVLAERISRTGSTQSFEKDLEKARSNFNINADKYWLPSAEASYTEALDLLENYKAKLMNGTAFFYNRTDNLIPLLRAYENLLGSCDDNLIKAHEDDGTEVSWFRADDYFYYARGVAAAMHAVLEAVAVDFAKTIETRRGTEVLHHALEALHHATQIEPILVFDSAPDGILANHRANMAGPISHARFYIGLLIETLST